MTREATVKRGAKGKPGFFPAQARWTVTEMDGRFYFPRALIEENEAAHHFVTKFGGMLEYDIRREAWVF